ncbi:hypothetical protein J3L12_14700 [Meiothermus sp. CFH 77666]|nr:hypothetical protein [Meiothermus sp. CFH 77666]
MKDLPLIEKYPSIILTAESRALRRKVREIQQKHPEWGPGPIKHALLQEGLIASREDIEKVMDKVDRYEDMLPLRIVKHRLGLW